MLYSNISLGDLALYNGCSPTFWSSIIYEHFTPPCEHIYCCLPYGLNLNQFSLFKYDCCQVMQSFKYYLDKKHAYSSNHISLWTTCTIRSLIQISVSIWCWIQIPLHWSTQLAETPTYRSCDPCHFCVSRYEVHGSSALPRGKVGTANRSSAVPHWGVGDK